MNNPTALPPYHHYMILARIIKSGEATIFKAQVMGQQEEFDAKPPNLDYTETFEEACDMFARDHEDEVVEDWEYGWKFRSLDTAENALKVWEEWTKRENNGQPIDPKHMLFIEINVDTKTVTPVPSFL